MYKPAASERKAKDMLYIYILQESWTGCISIRIENRNITGNEKKFFIMVEV